MSAHPPIPSPAGAPATPPQDRASRGPRRRTRAWVIAGIIALVVAVVAAWIVASAANSPRNQALRKAEDLIQGYLAGDPAALDALLDVSPATSLELLTPATARAAYGEAPRYRVARREADDSKASVRVYVQVGDRQVPLEVRLERASNSDYWAVTRIKVPTALVSTQAPSGIVKANGTELRLIPDQQRLVAVWPGTWTFASEGMVEVKHQFLDTQPPTPDKDGKGPGVIDLAPAPLTDETAAQAVQEHLAQCLGEGSPTRVLCPFGPPRRPSNAADVRNIEFSSLELDEPPRSEPDPFYNSRYLGSRSGTAKGSVLVTGQHKVGSRWQDFSERTTFSFGFSVRSGTDGVNVGVLVEPLRPLVDGQPSDSEWSRK